MRLIPCVSSARNSAEPEQQHPAGLSQTHVRTPTPVIINFVDPGPPVPPLHGDKPLDVQPHKPMCPGTQHSPTSVVHRVLGNPRHPSLRFLFLFSHMSETNFSGVVTLMPAPCKLSGMFCGFAQRHDFKKHTQHLTAKWADLRHFSLCLFIFFQFSAFFFRQVGEIHGSLPSREAKISL